jgi:hypothetical protein
MSPLPRPSDPSLSHGSDFIRVVCHLIFPKLPEEPKKDKTVPASSVDLSFAASDPLNSVFQT